MERESEANLKDELRRLIPSLFAAHGGQFVPLLRHNSKAFVAVGVLAQGVFFQFILSRDDLSVEIAPESKRAELRHLGDVMRSSDRFRDAQPIQKYSTLRVFARFLETHFEEIRAEIQDSNREISKGDTRPT
jgi:hypothetical protein